MKKIKLSEKTVTRLKDIEVEIRMLKDRHQSIVSTLIEHENVDVEKTNIRYDEGFLVLEDKEKPKEIKNKK